MTQHVLTSLGEAADRKLEHLADTSREKLENLKKKSMGELSSDTREWLKQNPGKTLLGALATGIVVGLLFRRR
jgi:ElaB/YqjD/DUF883 family membrane-anchored ribosome-binding protein